MTPLRRRAIRLASRLPAGAPLKVALLKAVEASSDPYGQEILRQLGGSRWLQMMIGAKNFMVGHTNGGALGGLSFKFPRPGRGKPNFVRILLMGDDTYSVEFMSLHGYNARSMSKVDGIYADQLRGLFERNTGLYLR